MITGVLIDWGGVLTTSLSVSIGKWIEADRIDDRHYRSVMRELIDQAYGGEQESVVNALERGEIDGAAFERDLAARLLTVDGVSPAAEGLLERMFAGFERVDAMYDMLRDVKRNGVKTCLLSNSWSNVYPRDDWDELFDAVVISGEVGMRKPEPRIFEHALGRVGLPGEACVFIDDIEINIMAARGLGMAGIHHRDADSTIAELETLLQLPLRRA
ncbi:HAD family hydrolase [Nonomuraea aurantiaca]|uniref:HAD family hydrolase n=1 Tax=Nonomuraea aurantiaca TaxID=2878562 RepID=UPI001CD91B67|nr:HAD family phosphatase [Nonomuraea aurantiaca]MCA2225531.1 HAD family phosphatase [Nonomuraea aurantiaca]